MKDILDKFGATAYIPGKKITLVISESKLLILDQVLRDEMKETRDKPA